jgi:hypothetical protein
MWKNLFIFETLNCLVCLVINAVQDVIGMRKIPGETRLVLTFVGST